MNLGLIVAVISSLWLISEIVLVRIKHSQATDVQLDKSSIRKLWITIVVSITLAIFVSSVRIQYLQYESEVYAIVGIILICIGLIVRWIAIISLKHQFTVDVSIRKDHRMITEGIYRYVRHPAYTGSLLSFLGLGFCFANYLSTVIVFVPICLAFLHRIRVEEEALVHAFGSEYLDYCALTKRLIPGIF